MTKYRDIQTAIEKVFASTSWTNNNIKTVPSNYQGEVHDDEYVRIEILMPNAVTYYGSTAAAASGLSGQIIIQIYTEAGKGVKRSYEIADLLDTQLQGKKLDGNVQTLTSSLDTIGQDRDDTTFWRVDYTLNFNYYPS